MPNMTILEFLITEQAFDIYLYFAVLVVVMLVLMHAVCGTRLVFTDRKGGGQ